MAQASAPPGSVPLPTDELNDDPLTPTWAPTDDRAPLRTTSPEPLPPSPPPRWKGKQREILSTHDGEPVVRQVDLGRTSVGQEGDEAPTESLVLTTYPPAAEEAIEERKVNETLKRWEQLERQRRKAARELLSTESNASANQSTVARSDTTRRGSLFWTSAKSRKPAPGSHPLSTADVGDRSPSAEDFGLPPESEELAVVQVRPPDEILLKSRESFVTRHKASSSLDSHVSDSSAATITPSNPTTPTVPTSSDPNSDPFLDPATHSQIRKGKETPRTMSRARTDSGDPFADENGSGDDTPHIPTHPPTAGSLGLKRPPRYPTPKPLGLPITARNAPADGSTNDPNKRQSVDGDDDDDDGPAEVGRWWTDWLCGCREGPNRGGDHQAGKTNPFE